MHVPVLLKEVLRFLAPQPNENFIDATFGEGGHSKAILEKVAPQGKVLAIEVDPNLYQRFNSVIRNTGFRTQDANRLILVNDSYIHLGQIAKKYKFTPVKGILFDLGISSWHLDESGKGFSFRNDEPLDMRFSSKNELTAATIINSWPRDRIEQVLRQFGEERYSKRIAQAILKARKEQRIISTFQLVDILKHVLPVSYQHRRLHFATRTFQALRIATNTELDNLQQGLEEALSLLPKGGRIVVISFHSLEDRITKHFFRDKALQQKLIVLTKKPIRPSPEEIRSNPRSRSAKLRAAQII